MSRTTVDDMVRTARAQLSRLSAVDTHQAMQDGRAVLVDVRTVDNRDQDGSVAGALEVSLNVLEWRMDPDSPSRDPRAPGLDDLVVIMCEQGYSSSLAAARLQALGFARATDVVDGFEGWRDAGLPVVH